MNLSKTLLTTAVTALAFTGVATAADAPVVSAQHSIAGAAPVSIPGTGIHQGEWMGSKALLVSRDVELRPGRRAHVRLSASGQRRIAGIALSQVRHVGARVDDVEYVGKRAVGVDLTLSAKAPGGGTTVTVFALTR